jgi:hypothetical protein
MDFITLQMTVYLLLTGAVVGFLSGLLGIGGGVIIIPTLIWLLSGSGVDDSVLTHIVFGTSLSVGAATAFSGAMAHRRQVGIPWDVVFSLASGSIIGAQVGGYAAHVLSGSLLQSVFGVHLLFMSFLMMRPLKRETLQMEEVSRNKLLLSGAGFIIGCISAVLGIGGAIISTVILVLLLRYPIHSTVGISASLMVFTATSGTFSYIVNGWNVSNLPPFSLGYVNVYLWLMLVLTSTVMAGLGARVTHRLEPAPLQQVFGIFLLVIGVKMFLGL